MSLKSKLVRRVRRRIFAAVGRYGGALVGLAPPNKAPSLPKFKQYKSVEFFSNLKVKPPLHKCKAPLIDDFLVTVLFRSQCKSLVVKGAKSVSMAISLTNRRDVTRTWKATCRFL